MITTLECISMGVCVTLVFGYWMRDRKRVHVALMAAAFATDMAMVGYIEWARDALATAQQKMGLLMIIHITLSVTIIVMYFGQLITGIKKARGRKSRWHGVAGLPFLSIRFAQLITSFLVMRL